MKKDRKKKREEERTEKERRRGRKKEGKKESDNERNVIEIISIFTFVTDVCCNKLRIRF